MGKWTKIFIVTNCALGAFNLVCGTMRGEDLMVLCGAFQLGIAAWMCWESKR